MLSVSSGVFLLGCFYGLGSAGGGSVVFFVVFGWIMVF